MLYPCLAKSPNEELDLKPMIQSFNSQNQPIHYFKYPIIGHCFWDSECQCLSCTFSYEEEDDRPSAKNEKHKDSLYQRYLDGDPTVGPLGEDDGKFQYIISYGTPKPIKVNPPSKTCQPPPTLPLPLPIPKKPVISPLCKPIYKWVKKNSYSLEILKASIPRLPKPKPLSVLSRICMVQLKNFSHLGNEQSISTRYPPLDFFF